MTEGLVFLLLSILISTFFLLSPVAHSVQCPARVNHIGERGSDGTWSGEPLKQVDRKLGLGETFSSFCFIPFDRCWCSGRDCPPQDNSPQEAILIASRLTVDKKELMPVISRGKDLRSSQMGRMFICKSLPHHTRVDCWSELEFIESRRMYTSKLNHHSSSIIAWGSEMQLQISTGRCNMLL